MKKNQKGLVGPVTRMSVTRTVGKSQVEGRFGRKDVDEWTLLKRTFKTVCESEN
jgi:hypothetical protein